MEGYFPQVVEAHADKIPDHPAYIFLDQTITYKNFDEQINRVANSFLAMGLKPGHRIATLLPQSPAFATVFMAAGKTGMVVVPLDPRFKAGEMKALCDRTRPRVLVSLAFPENIKKEAQALIRDYSFPHIFSYFGTLDTEGAQPYEALLDGSPNPVPEAVRPSADDPWIIIFTSGTTGRPKGAVITHGNSLYMAEATVRQWQITEKDICLCNMPTSHVAGTHDLIAAQLYGGATGILTPRFDPAEALELLGKYGITYFGGVPTMYRMILKTCDPARYDTSSVRMAAIAGEPSSAELIRDISAVFPRAKIVASWGMSETTGFFTFTRPDDTRKTVEETEGRPDPGFDMKIVDLDGKRAAPGEIGEMWVRGPSVITSYMDSGDNEGTFADGWLRTGDLGFLDDRGYLHFAGRVKEMYISGGYNVYPLEIESFLNACPGVNTSAVIEIPDDTWGEVGVAFVVPEEGADIQVKDLEKYCRQGLADYKRPKKFIIENDLPRSLIGKIAKKQLRKIAGQYLD